MDCAKRIASDNSGPASKSALTVDQLAQDFLNAFAFTGFTAES